MGTTIVLTPAAISAQPITNLITVSVNENNSVCSSWPFNKCDYLLFIKYIACGGDATAAKTTTTITATRIYQL